MGLFHLFSFPFVFFLWASEHSPSFWKGVALVHANEFSLTTPCVCINTLALPAQNRASEKSAKLEVGRSTQRPRDGGGVLMELSRGSELVHISVLRALKGVRQLVC